jgi:hypothetical protein
MNITLTREDLLVSKKDTSLEEITVAHFKPSKVSLYAVCLADTVKYLEGDKTKTLKDRNR